MTRLLSIIFLLISFTLTAHADAPRVSLLTCGVGGEIYELEGHTGLRIQHPVYGDFTVNWGVFDFNSPGFVYRFVKGETDYMAAATYTSAFLDAYRRQGRTVREQVLRLDSLQAERLTAMVMENVRPENRVYRYNYVLDNCATRPISFIEQATGDSIRFSTRAADLDEDITFRKVMAYFHLNYPWYQFGIDLALGSGIDYPIDVRATGFAPAVLQEIATHATIGDSVPLIRSTEILVKGPAEGAILPPTPWYLTPLTAMWVLCGGCLAVAVAARSRNRIMRGWQALFFSVMGVAGCVIAFLVVISTHEATSPNWIILWMNPFCLLMPALMFIPCALRLTRWYVMANLFMIAVYAITCAFGVQAVNQAFIPLALADIIMSLSYLRQTREKIG